jgi:hypothetical protein
MRLEGLRKTTKNNSQDSCVLGEMNMSQIHIQRATSGPSRNGSSVLILRMGRSGFILGKAEDVEEVIGSGSK